MAVNGKAPDVARLVQEFPPQREMSEQGELLRGLTVRLQIQRPPGTQEGSVGAMAELHLGDSAKFFPTDAALAGWRAQADQGKAVIAYD